MSSHTANIGVGVTAGPPMKVPGYDLQEELSRSAWHVLHRGRRREDGRAALVKVPRSNPARDLEVELLRREHAILRELNLPGVPRPLGLGGSDGNWWLALDDAGGNPLRSHGRCQRLPLSAFLDLAIRLATTLAELHRRDLIHQNINPWNILRDAESGGVCLADFGLCVSASGGKPAPPPAHALRSVLTYLSPEQTERMNRMGDYRSDLYSLGVTLYEVLTGAPPFESEDPLELIHWHIAKPPTTPRILNPEIPEIVAQIVMKLLAKTPEERYQSVQGLRADLEICAHEYATKRQITPFPVARRDVSDRFWIPQKLYGRAPELLRLIQSFERACTGQATMMVVTGYAGVGKTALIEELHRRLVRQRGYFVAGKFDQIVRGIPYGALIQALRRFIQQLLTESEDRLRVWRARLADTLGPNGGVLAAVIPEIELILGAQPPPPALGPMEAQNRFQLVFQKFVGTVGQQDYPLVIFLDDLQWADSATLSLLQPLLRSPDVRFLYVIGAYRDNEVDATHLLTQTLTLLETSGSPVERIVLGPLPLAELTLLIQDTIHAAGAEVEPLAGLVLQKTDGNPLFVLQFLKALRQEGLIEFDYEQGRWAFRLDAIAGVDMTANVIDLMTRKIQRLSPDAQRSLTLAACIGNPFDIHVLGIISRQSTEAAAEDLREALEAGLLLPAAGHDEVGMPAARMAYATTPTGYAFLHDRVQQAAYALIPEERRRLVHLTVGRLLLAEWDPTTAEERLFDLAHHWNLGRDLITDPGERFALAQLNLRAGRRAKSSTAYQAALGYFSVGVEALGEEYWSSEYEIAMALHLEVAECEYLCGHFETAEQKFDQVLARARTREDKVKVYSLKILYYEHTSRYTDAIRAGRAGLALFDVIFPDEQRARRIALDAELAAIQAVLAARTVESLVDLPTMQDPELRAIMRILANLHTSCFLSGDKTLTLLNTATMVRLSLVHGNVEESAYAYALHAAMLEGPAREDYRAAYDFGLLALRLNERLFDPAWRAKVLMMFAWAISLWRAPLEASFAVTREAFRLGHETGLFVDAAWALFNEIWFALLTSTDLESFYATYSPHVDYSVRVKMPHIADAKRVILQWGRALQGRTAFPLSLDDATFDEAEYCRRYEGQRLFEMFYCVAKLAVLYTLDEWAAACEAARKAESVIQRDFTGTIWDALRVFYHALALSALHVGRADRVTHEVLAELETCERRLRVWAENCPRNFEASHLIVSAECARLHGQDAEAMKRYDAAIAAATAHERLHERALAHELYAKFWQARGQGRLTTVFMTEARDRYAQWGALAKVRDLERRYSAWLTPQVREALRGPSPLEAGQPDLHIVSAPAVEALDVSTVVKAAQAIAGEIELPELLAKLMRIAIENAGAERACLILEIAGGPSLCAQGSLDAAEASAVERVPLEAARDVPASIVNYVRRTAESVVLADAGHDERYGADPYICERRPRSILCTPIIHQGHLIGALYLENNLTADAFTPKRIELMQILASQAAISLENARLYAEMKHEVDARRRAEEGLRAALEEVERLKNRLQAENVYLQEEIRREHNFVEMVGSSPALLAVLRKLEQVAATDSTVLVCGETGTGKELIARAIHSRSARKDRPLVKVNCSAISAGLVESELFGHVKGAFTGALERRIGRFELADRGTIFLDEVGELPLETQAKLLRVLQEGEFEPVGSSKSLRVDVRLIAATNRDLGEAIRSGRFRSDLFYRLNVFPLTVPPLRDRRADMPLLVRYFLLQFCKKFGKKIDTVPRETMARLVEYPWPGNIRELQNVIEHAVILSAGPVLEMGHDVLPSLDAKTAEAAVGTGREGLSPEPANGADASSAASFPSLEALERHHIHDALERSGGVIEGVGGAAKMLAMHPNTLRSRMKKLGIKRPTHEIS